MSSSIKTQGHTTSDVVVVVVAVVVFEVVAGVVVVVVELEEGGAAWGVGFLASIAKAVSDISVPISALGRGCRCVNDSSW